MKHSDLAVKVDACWALSFLAEGKDRQIQVSVKGVSAIVNSTSDVISVSCGHFSSSTLVAKNSMDKAVVTRAMHFDFKM